MSAPATYGDGQQGGAKRGLAIPGGAVRSRAGHGIALQSKGSTKAAPPPDGQDVGKVRP